MVSTIFVIANNGSDNDLCEAICWRRSLTSASLQADCFVSTPTVYFLAMTGIAKIFFI
jgi:hypothetical protein